MISKDSIFFIIIASLIMIPIILIFISLPDYSVNEHGKCYDKRGSEIKGLECIEIEGIDLANRIVAIILFTSTYLFIVIHTIMEDNR